MKKVLAALIIFCISIHGEVIAQCGTVNRVLGLTTVTANSAIEYHDPTKATDGSAGTSWYPIIEYNQDAIAYLVVNMQASYNVCKVEIDWDGTFSAQNYTIDVSSDGTNWSTIKTVTGNTAATNSWTGLNGTGSYVRVRVTRKQGTYMNYGLVELRVYNQDVQLPTISITSPTPGQSFNAGSNVTLSATATNAYKVEFFYEVNGSTSPIGNAIFQAPYTTSWVPTQGGLYKIKATATSNLNSTTTAEVSITINNTIADAWSLYGNLGTNPLTQYLGTKDNKDLVFRTNDAQRLSILSNGKVKIGTLGRPATEADALLSVYGTIYATKIKVTQQNWADFVFEKNYKLMNLSHVEAFIKRNHHLPGLPSAVQIAERGLDIGEGQALLLKKVEELTLYIIEQQKRIRVLERQVLRYNKK